MEFVTISFLFSQLVHFTFLVLAFRSMFQAISHIHIGVTILIASHTFVSITCRGVIKNYLLLFQHGAIFRLYVRTEEDNITFDAGRVISFSPKVKNIVKEED